MDDALLTLTEIMELCRKKEKAALELYQYNHEMIAKEYETEFTIIEGYIPRFVVYIMVPVDFVSRLMI
jgi:hypothetical protein